jgi:isopentenyldiphosphate isomerase
MKTEIFPVVDEQGHVIGKASRKLCHSGSFLLHPVVHLHLLDSRGRLYLQKRSAGKDIQPGKWDTSVGGHVDYGESIEEALFREAREELGLKNLVPVFMHRYIFRSAVETELVNSYYTLSEEVPEPDPVEISEGRFWTAAEIEEAMGRDVFTPNFEDEFRQLVTAGLLPVR